MFILKNKAQSLKGTEAYLQHRGWKIKISEKLKDALLYIIQSKPKYFIFPSDYPNKKIRTLPPLIRQAFPGTILIAYSESSAPSALAKLKDTGVEFLLYPPVSGTTIERIVQRIQRGPESNKKEKRNFSKNPTNSESEDDDLMFFKKDSSEPSGSSADSAREALNKILFVAGNEGGEKETSDYESSDPQERDNFAYDPGSSPLGQEFAVEKGVEDQGPQRAKGHLGNTHSIDTRSNYQDSNTSGPSRTQEIPDDPAGELLRQLMSDDPNETVIVKGTREALKETVQIGDSVAINKLNEVSNACCITVESTRFNGYLIAACASGDENSSHFFEKVKDKLFEFLKAYGEEFKDTSSSMKVKLQQVAFESWALTEAEFLKKAAHNGNEIAMAFFPTNSTKVELGESFAEHMAALKMEELTEDANVEFDLYIYMPENKKYLLYTPQGRPLFKNQKDRLKDKGLTEMHLRKDSTAQVRKYRAQNFLNEKIKQFKEKRSKASA